MTRRSSRVSAVEPPAAWAVSPSSCSLSSFRASVPAGEVFCPSRREVKAVSVRTACADNGRRRQWMTQETRWRTSRTRRSRLCSTRSARFRRRRRSPRQANVRDAGVYRKADRDFEKFWADFARELVWFKPWKKVLDWKPPRAKWFVGGKLNASVNCLDRHLDGPRRNKAALDLGRRAGRPARPDLSGAPPRGLQVRERPEVARDPEGRPRDALPPDDPGAARSRCSPARASGRSTPSSSADSRPSRCATASTTRGRACSSPPTAAGGAARWCR